MQHLEDTGPCVVMATPSMLQSGLSRDVFEAWCQDPRNGVIIADFAVQGTLAKELISQPKEVLLRSGQKVRRGRAWLGWVQVGCPGFWFES